MRASLSRGSSIWVLIGFDRFESFSILIIKYQKKNQKLVSFLSLALERIRSLIERSLFIITGWLRTT